ncbi:MAG: hypothetical protein ACI82F_002543 [Planctomycetota bacterium]|jgi:hypothetical protein
MGLKGTAIDPYVASRVYPFQAVIVLGEEGATLRPRFAVRRGTPLLIPGPTLPIGVTGRDEIS